MKLNKQHINALYNRFLYADDPAIVNAKYKNNLNLFMNQLLPATLLMSLVGGAFLTGVMLHMNFSDTMIAMIVLIPSILGVVSLLAGPILEKLNRRKPFVLSAIVIVNFFRAAVVFIPYFFNPAYHLIVFLTMFTVAFSLNAILAVAFNNLYINSLEKEIQAKYIGLRNKISLLFHIIFPMLIAIIVDLVPQEQQYTAFTIMFSLSFVFALVEVWVLRRLEEPQLVKMEAGDINFKNVLMIPIKNKAFMKITAFSCAFYFTYFISGSFLNVFMLRYLGMSYSIFTLGITLNFIIQFFTYGFCSKIVHRFGSAIPMALGILFHSFFSLFFVFSNERTIAFWYCLAYVVLATLIPAFNIAIYKIRFDVMGDQGQTYYDGFYTACVGLTILVAPLIGGVFKDIIENATVIMQRLAYAQFKIPLFTSFVTMALTGWAAFVSMKKESHEVDLSKQALLRLIRNETVFGRMYDANLQRRISKIEKQQRSQSDKQNADQDADHGKSGSGT